jgi:hypothetical protein
VFATSRKLTPPQRRALERAAGKLGFTLINIYERSVIAELLYYSPRWCRDLLAITTARPALSALPLDRRPFFDRPTRGRDAELAWLKEQAGDTLLVGQPGVGKTFLLRQYATEVGALFAVTEDTSAIDAAIRELQPKVIVVSDAHTRLALLKGLRQLRADTGGRWRVSADCWPGAKAAVQGELLLSDAQTRVLQPLARDVVVQIIRDIGIIGPNPLIRELVDQSRGRAGLAATLAFLCLRGDSRRVGLGQVIADEVKTGLKELVGQDAIDALTMLSIGGGNGLPLSIVAQELHVPEVKLQQAVTDLAAGGVVEEVKFSNDAYRIAVQPEALRDALVGNHFFGKFSIALPEPLLAAAQPDSLTSVLLGAARRGAAVPDQLLWKRLQAAPTANLIGYYIALGPPQARRAIQAHPDMLSQLAPIGLRIAPDTFLPLLFGKAVGDERPTHAHPSHPLRQIEDWVHSGLPGTDAIQRRCALVDAAERWLNTGGDAETAIRATSFALMPTFSTCETGPGSGNTVVLTRGVITAEELSAVDDLWNRVVTFLPVQALNHWDPLLHAINGLASPTTISRVPGKAFYTVAKDVAGKAVKRLAAVAQGRPGVLLELSEAAGRLGVAIAVDVNPDFAALYAHESYDKMGTPDAEGIACVRAFGSRLAAGPPEEAAKLLSAFAVEADAVGRTSARLRVLGAAISKKCPALETWIGVFSVTWPDTAIITPMLSRLYHDDRDAFLAACRDCWRVPQLRPTVAEFILITGQPPSDLLGEIISALPEFPGVVQILCLRRQIPVNTLRKLLSHENDAIAAAAAAGEWRAESRGTVREEVRDLWRSAILRCGSTQQREMQRVFIGDILQADACLAFDWILARIRDGQLPFWHPHEELGNAVGILSADQRLAVLIAVKEHEVYAGNGLIAGLIGGNAEIYRRVLGEPKLKRLHLLPLACPPSPQWVALATAALDTGYSDEDVLRAATGGMQSWTGLESAHWNRWRTAWESTQSNGDQRIQNIARRGAEQASRKAAVALEQENRVSVYGDY